jgi:hypothetical protein
MENTGTNQTNWTEREKQLAEKFKVEPKLVRLLFEIISEQQHPIDPLQPDRNSIIIEDFFFERIEFSGQLAAVLLFNLLMSSSPRHRSIGRHIITRLYEEIEETTGLTTQEDLYFRELLFAIAERKARKSA